MTKRISTGWKTTALMTVSLFLTTGLMGASASAANLPAQSVHAKRDSGPVVHLTYWNMWSGIWTQLVGKMVDTFNKTHPNIQVQMLSVPSSDGEQKLMTSIAAGDPPDVFTEWNPEIAAFAQQNALVNLNQFMVGKYAGLKTWFYPVATKFATYQGKLYAMPWTMNTFLLYYNKSIMQSSGLNPNDPPKTIAQLNADQAKEWKISKKGVVSQMGFYPGGSNQYQDWLSQFNAQNLLKKGKYNLLTPQDINLVNWIRTFKKYPYAQVNAFETGFGNAVGGSEDPFEMGKAGFFENGMWEMPMIQQYNPTLKYGVVPNPVAPGGAVNSSYVNGNFNEIPAGSKHPKQAFEFIAWLSGYDNAAWAASAYPAGGWIPNSPHITAQPAYQKFLNQDPLRKPFVNVMLNPRDALIPVTPQDMLYLQKMQNATDYVLQGIKTPKQALLHVQLDTNQALAQTH